RIPSKSLPLGVSSSDAFDPAPGMYEMAPGDRVFLRSDGIHETVNAAGDMFGEDRLEAILHRDIPMAAMFDAVMQAVNTFAEGTERTDDVSLVELVMMPRQAFQAGSDFAPLVRELQGPVDWSLDYELR